MAQKHETIMLNQTEERSIPGMVELVESQLLFNLARNLTFQEGDSVVEFGTFFGRSTNAISQGLRQNSTFTTTGNFFAYDSFSCKANGGFYKHVLAFSKRGNVEHLIKRHDKSINFFPVFEYYLKDYIDKEIVIPITAELADSEPYTDSIILMHIDSPKFYEEFKIIMFDFLTKMRIGSVVIFQDFFYHWSATLIAVVGILLKRKHLKITETAASALACQVIKPVEMRDAVQIDLLMNKETEIVNCIDIAFAECREIEATKFDRQDQFLPRITLAKCQWLLENGDSEGGNIWHTMLNTREALIQDMNEMSRYNFSIRENYELDYKT
jgi:hypothetical protein